MRHDLLNNLSGALVLVVITTIFCLLFEPRFSRRRYLASLLPFLLVLYGANFYVIFRYGFAAYGKVTLLLATIPSLVYFFIVSKHRDGRFFFTFCLVDTSSIWFVLLTGFIDYLAGGEGLANFVIRIAATPLVVYAVARRVRPPFMTLLRTVKRGWWLFTALTAMVYIILVVMMSFPVSLRDRPDDIPLALAVLVFLPLTYATIFYVLYYQQKLHDMGTLQHAFSVQSAMIEARAEEIGAAEERVRIERHDLRHRLNVIEEFAQRGDQERMLEYLGAARRTLDEGAVERFCANPIMDAIFSSCFRKARGRGIEVRSRIVLPDELPVPAAELATVLSNLLENAIAAVESLPEERRQIVCVCISRPALMVEVRNPYEGKVRFDEGGLPVSESSGHGIGSRSIAAFCKRHDGVYAYEAKDGWFGVRIGL